MQCIVEGCGKKHKSRGLCDTHYAFWRRTGQVGRRERKSLADRLWSKVDKSAGNGPSGDCWEWRGYVHATGYGHIWTGGKQGEIIATHRAAWIVTSGDIRDGLFVLHKCDNRLCVNPDHLWLGDHAANMADMLQKGRRRPASATARGAAVNNAKLTDEIVRAMRAEPPMTFKALGEKYGVTAGTAHKIIMRQTWAHVKE